MNSQNEQVSADGVAAGVNTAAGFGTAASVNTAVGADAVAGAAVGAGSAVSDGAAVGVGAAAGTAERFASMEAIKQREGKRYGYLFCKRAFDVVFSGCVIVAAFIPSLVLCAIIRGESKGFPIYSQQRVGRMHRNGEIDTFTMYKFRSMVHNADELLEGLLDKNEAQGALFKMKDDPRITKVGRFIRKHSIDEFPQFINVFKGDMSLVGPRPPLPRELDAYTERDLQRLAVRPGLTGPWQVSGRSNVGFNEMVEMDLDYIKHRTFMGDLKYIAKTVGVIFTGGALSRYFRCSIYVAGCAV